MSTGGPEKFGLTAVLLIVGALVASACTAANSPPVHNDDPSVISPRGIAAVRTANVATPDDRASTTTTTAPIVIEWVTVDPSPIELGDVIDLRGQLAAPLPEVSPWLNIWLLRMPSYSLAGRLCGTRVAADGSFGCTRGSTAPGPDEITPGVYVIAVGDPWDVVMDATFEIVGSVRD
ncbi:MAG: hypothetical protein ACC683_11195 [Acidimicrobiia bacterium]